MRMLTGVGDFAAPVSIRTRHFCRVMLHSGN
jgi:hypothetical protein